MSLNDAEFLESVRRHRDAGALDLNFTPEVRRLIETDRCNELTADMSREGHRWERFKAVAELGPQLPRIHGLYMFAWRPALTFQFDHVSGPHEITWILYIGKAGVRGGTDDTIQDRYQREYRRYIGKDPKILWSDPKPRMNREDRLARFLTLRPLEYWFLRVDDLDYLSTLERRLLNALQPPLNSHHSGPRVRPSKTEPAF